MVKREPGKPRGRMSSYAFFVQICREEHKKKHPDETVVFAEFSRKCAEKWKAINAKEKRRFEELADKDKARYNSEMEHYEPPPGENGEKSGKKRKRTKDPNAPKRPLSGFFFFCADERADVRKQNPTYALGDVAKELGKRWEHCPNRPKYEALAQKDKQRYEKDMEVYKKTGKKPKVEAAKPPPPPPSAKEESDDDDDDEEDEEDDDDEEEDDE